MEYGVGQPSQTASTYATIIILAEASIYSLRRAEPTRRILRKWAYNMEATFTTVSSISSADMYGRLPTGWRGSVVRRRQLSILIAATLSSKVERMQCGWCNSSLDGLDYSRFRGGERDGAVADNRLAPRLAHATTWCRERVPAPCHTAGPTDATTGRAALAKGALSWRPPGPIPLASAHGEGTPATPIRAVSPACR